MDEAGDEIEYRVVTRQGETRWQLSKGETVQLNEHGKPRRVVGTVMGIDPAPNQVAAANEGKWGRMTALRSTSIEMVELSEAVKELKTVPPELYREAEVFFG